MKVHRCVCVCPVQLWVRVAPTLQFLSWPSTFVYLRFDLPFVYTVDEDTVALIFFLSAALLLLLHIHISTRQGAQETDLVRF